jgi:hypothetical protein
MIAASNEARTIVCQLRAACRSEPDGVLRTTTIEALVRADVANAFPVSKGPSAFHDKADHTSLGGPADQCGEDSHDDRERRSFS